MRTHRVSPVAFTDVSNSCRNPAERLLDRWLALPDKGRKEEFADTARAAEIAGVSPRTLRHWIDAGYVLSVRIGKTHRIHLKSLRDYLEAQTQG
jgi:excisionase family DNA binding protein